MKIYVMRHGSAEDFAASGHDADRALTAVGRERVRHVAKLLGAHDEAPKLIVSSPLVRALQTAEIVAAELGLEYVDTSRALAPGGQAPALVAALLREAKKRVMLVGHEPDLSALVSELTGQTFTGMQKAMVVGLMLRAGEAARQRFILDPKAMSLQRLESV